MLGAVALASTRADAEPLSQQGQFRTADSCGRADPSYLRVANETGGQPLFLKPSEAGSVGQFLREMSGNNHETLLWATGPFGRSRLLSVPVDGTIERLTFSMSSFMGR